MLKLFESIISKIKNNFFKTANSNIHQEIKKKVSIQKNSFHSLKFYEIGLVKDFADIDFRTERKKSYGFIETLSFRNIYFQKKDLWDKETKKNDIVIFKYGKNYKGKIAINIIVLKDNKASLKSLSYFYDKFYEINSHFFESYQVRELTKIFFSEYFIKDMEENIYLMLLRINMKHNKLDLIDNFVVKYKKITNPLIVILESSLNSKNIKQFLNLINKDSFLEYELIKNKMESIPEYSKFKYQKLLNDIEKCQKYSHIDVSYSTKEIYDSFSTYDYTLAKQWIKKTNNFQFEYARMISARGAELAAIKFYKLLGCKVIDTAITQLNYKNNDWKFFDLHTDNRYIDVKNSRGVLNERLSYSEHCIPKFKEFRTGEYISILGVISPYIQLKNDKSKLDSNILDNSVKIEHKISILGETSLNEINNYSIRFSKKELEVDLVRMNFTPDWILEYPKIFYAQRDELKSNFLKNHIEFPNYNEYKQLDKNLIPFFLSCGLDLPNEWKNNVLNKEQINFYNRLKGQARESVTKPFLYLAILKHFSERFKENFHNVYTPLDYEKLIYNDSNFIYPLGIYDRTLIIKKLIDTLETLWQQKNKVNVLNYITFKYNQKGILLAKTSMSSSWDTLLAYCGGFIDGKGSCGFKPLIRGKHVTCKFCNKIICPKCNFCKDGCRRPKMKYYF